MRGACIVNPRVQILSLRLWALFLNITSFQLCTFVAPILPENNISKGLQRRHLFVNNSTVLDEFFSIRPFLQKSTVVWKYTYVASTVMCRNKNQLELRRKTAKVESVLPSFHCQYIEALLPHASQFNKIVRVLVCILRQSGGVDWNVRQLLGMSNWQTSAQTGMSEATY